MYLNLKAPSNAPLLHLHEHPGNGTDPRAARPAESGPAWLSGHTPPPNGANIWSTIGPAVRQRWGTVLGTTGVCVAAAGLYLSQVTPQYQAVVVVRLERPPATAEQPAERAHEQHLKKQLAMLKGRHLAEYVVDELGLDRARLKRPVAPVVEPQSTIRDRQPYTPDIPGLTLQLDRKFRSLRQYRDPAHWPPDNVLIAREAAIRALRASLSINPVPLSDLVQIRVLDPNPSQAVQNANALARGFLAMLGAHHLAPASTPSQNQPSSSATPVTGALWANWPPAGPHHEWLQSRLDADMKRLLSTELLTPITPWWLAPDVFANVPNPPVTDLGTDMADDMAHLQNQFIVWKLQQAQALSSPVVATGAALLSEATAPRRPHTPRPHKLLGLAFVLGLMAGTLLALRKGPGKAAATATQDTTHRVPGLLPLGSVPRVALPAWADSVPVAKLTHTDPQGPLAQAHRSIAQALLKHPAIADHAQLLVTSQNEGDGCTTTAVGLAIALSQLGQTVLLIDANLRAPGVHQTLQLPNDVGLSQQLGLTPATPLPIQASAIENLSVLTAGPNVAEPLKHLLGPGLDTVLAEVAQRGYQRVVIDSAPLHGQADALVLAHQVPHVLLVVQQPQAAQGGTAMAARQKLKDAGAQWVGWITTQTHAD